MTLEIEGLCAAWGRRRVLHDVTLSPVPKGAFVGLIGPNAAGKSTLFQAISGLIRPQAGHIRLGGADLGQLHHRERARKVAYMPQAFATDALLTVYESVLLALKQTTGWRVKEDHHLRVLRVLEALNLSHIASRGLSDLSGGQAQMAAVARTLVREPEIILLDEPTSALDLHHQLSILSSVRAEMRRSGAIVMAALHDLNLAAEFCDWLILIREGRVVAEGRPGEILALPEIGETYRVETALERTKRGSLYVDATL